jgi:hypothetical protein
MGMRLLLLSALKSGSYPGLQHAKHVMGRIVQGKYQTGVLLQSGEKATRASSSKCGVDASATPSMLPYIRATYKFYTFHCSKAHLHRPTIVMGVVCCTGKRRECGLGWRSEWCKTQEVL